MSDQDPQQAMPAVSRRRRLWQFAAIAASLLLIGYFMRRYSTDISALRNLAAGDVILIGLWLFVSYVSYAYAVYVSLLDVGLRGLGPLAWLRIYFASRLVNMFVAHGGNVLRLVLLKKQFGFAYANNIGISLFLVWLNAVISLLVSCLLVAGRHTASGKSGAELALWMLAGAALLLLAALAAVLSIRRLTSSAWGRNRWVEAVTKMADFFVHALSNGRLLSLVLALSTVQVLSFLAVNVCIFNALGYAAGLPEVAVFTTAFAFTRYVNIVPANLGVSELVAGLTSELLGTGFGPGLLVSGILRIVEALMIILSGALYGNAYMIRSLRRRGAPQ